MTYEQFLDRLATMPNATACYSVEINAEKYGKSVRQVSADFRARFGTYL